MLRVACAQPEQVGPLDYSSLKLSAALSVLVSVVSVPVSVASSVVWCPLLVVVSPPPVHASMSHRCRVRLQACAYRWM